MAVKAGNARKELRIIHHPRLDTIIMVEETLQRMSSVPTKNQLWRALPKAVMWQTYCLIIEYLERSRKVRLSDGKVEWIFARRGRAPKEASEPPQSHGYIG